MPSYHSAGLRVHLAAAPLAQSLTTKVAFKKGYTASAQAERAERVLRQSGHTTLHEERVSLPGDDSNFGLNWLGDTPFFQVVVEKPSENARQLADLRNRLTLDTGDTSVEGPRRSSRATSTKNGHTVSSDHVDSEEKASYQAERVPDVVVSRSTCGFVENKQEETRALVLHVMLTDKTFYYDPFNVNPQDIKIDVFFNGQFTNSTLVHTTDIRAGLKSHNQIFAGTRIDYQVERPWVIHAPCQSTGAGLAAARSVSAQDRWLEICKALMVEANERGIDEDGKGSPAATYLHKLANMQMPDGVDQMQKAGGRKFGVIDVVVTIGFGKKNTTRVAYLKAPTRLQDDSCSNQVEKSSCFEETKAGAPTAEQGPAIDSDQEVPSGDERDAEGEEDPEFFTEVAAADMYRSRGPVANPQPQPTVQFRDPFHGGQIRSHSQADLASPNELPAKRRHFGDEAPIVQTNPYPMMSGQITRAQPPYRSAHAPSIPRPVSYEPPVAPSGFNVNPYDSFEHANPYQLPYTGMMDGLSFASYDGHASSPPLAAYSGGPIDPSSYAQRPREVMPGNGSRAGAMSTGYMISNAYQQHVPLSNHNSRASFMPMGPTAFHPAMPLMAPPMGLGTPGYGSFPHPSTMPMSSPAMQESTFRPYSNPYMPPPRRPSSGAPPPIGMFKVTPTPKPKIPIDPRLMAKTRPKAGPVVRRLSIKCDGRPVLDHRFDLPRHLPSRAVNASSNRSNLATPPASSPNVTVDPGRNIAIERAKKDSIHDYFASTELAQRAANSTAKEAKPVRNTTKNEEKSIPAPTSSRNRTVSTGILGVQGPKANGFVFDDPEELLRKKKPKPQSKSSSISPNKAETPVASQDGHSDGRTGKSSKPVEVNLGSSSPLSELSHSPELPFTLESPNERLAHLANSSPALPSPAIPTASPPSSVPGATRSSTRLSSKATAKSSAPAVQPAASFKPVEEHLASAATPKPKPATPKPSRSPGRLSAKENPPLNRGCVIQYAVSEREGGALRQVRSERVGTFREDNVVMAVRFFVPA